MIMLIKILFNYQGERTQGECVVRANGPDTYLQYEYSSSRLALTGISIKYLSTIHESSLSMHIKTDLYTIGTIVMKIRGY